MEAKKILEQSIKEHLAAIDKARAELAKAEVTYSVGDRFYYQGNREAKRLLVRQWDNKVSLIDLATGMPVATSPAPFPDHNRIPKDDMERFCYMERYTRYWDSQKKILTI